MRQLWNLIESTQVSTLLQLDDLALVQSLLKQFTAQQTLDARETSTLNTYINSRLLLIRDTAQHRATLGQANN